MGLLKSDYTNVAKVPVPYWNIVDIHINKAYKTVEATFVGWYSQGCSKEANVGYVEMKKVRCLQDKFDLYFSIDTLNNVNDNPIKQAYVYAKENDTFFQTATDVLE